MTCVQKEQKDCCVVNRLWGAGEAKEVRNGGGLNQGKCGRHGERLQDSGRTRKVEPTGMAEALDLVLKKAVSQQ